MDRGPGRFRVPSGPPGGRQGGDCASGRQLLRHAQKPYRPQAAVVPRGLARAGRAAAAQSQDGPTRAGAASIPDQVPLPFLAHGSGELI